MDTRSALLQLSVSDLDWRLRRRESEIQALAQQVSALARRQVQIQSELSALLASLQALWAFVTPEDPEQSQPCPVSVLRCHLERVSARVGRLEEIERVAESRFAALWNQVQDLESAFNLNSLD